MDEQSRLRLLSMIQAGIPNVVPAAAQAGDASVLKNYLEKHPHEVYTIGPVPPPSLYPPLPSCFR